MPTPSSFLIFLALFCVSLFSLWSIQPKLTQDIKDFFKVLGRRMTRPSGRIPTHIPPPEESLSVTNHHGMHIQMEATSSEVSVNAVSLPQVPVAMDADLDSLIVQLEDENR